MVYQITGICQHCSASVKVAVQHKGKKGLCPACGQKPFRFKKYEGVVYVLSNRHQKGLIKVGMTTKGVEERAKELSTTGVAGEFKVLAVFPSHRPAADEKKAHKKLRTRREDGEFFSIEPAKAITKIRSALQGREPIIYDKALEAEVEHILAENRRRTNRRFGRGQSI